MATSSNDKNPSGSSTPASGSAPPMSPGDEAPAGTPGTGEASCPRCGGSGKIAGQRCAECAGTGKITQGIGGG